MPNAVVGTFLLCLACPFGVCAFVQPSRSVTITQRSLTTKQLRNSKLFVSAESLEDSVEECNIFNIDACTDAQVTAMANPPSRLQKTNLTTNDQQVDFSQYLKDAVTQPVVEVILVALVLLSCFVVGVGTLQSLPPMLSEICQFGEILVSALFTMEYIVRWYLQDFSPKYVIKPLAIIDLIAILPGIMQVVAMLGVGVPANLLSGALVNLRLLRVLRLQRVLKDYDTFCKFAQVVGLDPSDIRPYQLQLARVVISIFTLLSVTAGLVYSAEHTVNPDIPDYFTALYFALTTISTVGFGDISPHTTAGRWAVSASILVGVAVVPAQAAALADALLNQNNDAAAAREKKNPNVQDDKQESSGIARPLDTTTVNGLSLEPLDSRMNDLEKRLDQTNAKLDKILEKLE